MPPHVSESGLKEQPLGSSPSPTDSYSWRKRRPRFLETYVDMRSALARRLDHGHDADPPEDRSTLHLQARRRLCRRTEECKVHVEILRTANANRQGPFDQLKSLC